MFPEFVLPRRRRRPGSRTARARSSAGRPPSGSGGRWATASRCRPPSGARRTTRRTGSSTSTASTTGPSRGTDTTQFFFHYKYLDEARLFGEGNVGWYVVRIADPAKAPQVAARLDAQFANSPAETKTTTEKAFAQAFANQVGDIGLIVRSIGAAASSSRPAPGRRTRWRSRCASGRASWRCSRRLASPTAAFSRSCCIEVVPARRASAALLGLGDRLVACVGQGDPDRRPAARASSSRAARLASGVALVLGLGVGRRDLPGVRGPCACASWTRCGGS